MGPNIHLLSKLFQKSLSLKPHQIKFISLYLPKFLCTTTQLPPTHDSSYPPHHPTWHNQNPNLDNRDFVSPSLANWVGNPTLQPCKSIAVKEDSDVDKVSEILKQRFSSEDGVVKALNGSGIDATNDMVSQLLERFSNQWVQAFGVFIWAKQQTGYVHTPELYDFMIDILGKCKKFGIMWELLREMNGLNGYVSLGTMSKVFRRLARDGKNEDAIDAFRRMEKFGVKRDTEALNLLMDALVKQGGVKDAHSVFLEFMDKVTLDSRPFNILVHGYCIVGMLNDARKMLEEMEKHGFHPDVLSYTCFIEAYCKVKDFHNVVVILNEMQEKGCECDAVPYTIYMRALAKARRLKEAFEVYERMKKNGCMPDTKFYSTFIYILSHSGRIQDAWNVFEDIEKHGVGQDLWTYNTMIFAACAHWQIESALKLLERLEKDLCKPNIETYQALLKLCCKKKNMKMLKFLLTHMAKNNISIDHSTYSLLVRRLCESGKLEHPCFFFQEAVRNGIVLVDRTYNALLEELERNNMAEMKEKIEKLMSRVKQQI